MRKQYKTIIKTTKLFCYDWITSSFHFTTSSLCDYPTRVHLAYTTSQWTQLKHATPTTNNTLSTGMAV